MTLTPVIVRDIFRHLEDSDSADFFVRVADNVDWIMHGHHPLAGHYYNKADFLAGTFEKLGKVLPQATQLQVNNVMVFGNWAVVELSSLATARNGLLFDHQYCWLARFAAGKIVEVRAYLDSALMQRLFDENPL